MNKLLPIALLAATCAASAAEPVFLEVPITFAPGAKVVEKVREECKLEEMFAREAGKVFARKNRGEGTVDAADTRSGTRVRVQISYVMGVGGGGWSGPKSISIHADLVENGQVTHKTTATRATMGGAFGGFKGTCTLLERSAVTLGKDLVRWAYDPNRRPLDEGTPKSAETDTEANE